MCGIYGILDFEDSVSRYGTSWAEQAGQLLSHRGPDGNALLTRLEGHCLLGHSRLAIIDLAGGAQPICNEDGTIWVIFNGEIYNYLEIRDSLIAKGHRFRTQSDTEVLVHLFEEKGHALVDDLEGMYAFAILDERNRQIFLARDRFGEKPLYWSFLSGGKGIGFASEMKALLSLSDVTRRLDVAAVAQFLALGYVPAPRSHLKSVRKLQAGEALSFDGKVGLRQWRYWQPHISLNGHNSKLSRQEAVEEARDRIHRSVHLRLRSDVPVGAFLSGGVDSTYIAGAVRELLPAARFNTFCASFDDVLLDEAPYARVVAEHLGSDHHEVHFSSSDLLEVFDALIDHYDEPFADVSMFPTFAVCHAARQYCKVMLSGDGGDECFGGYREFFSYYRWHKLRRLTAATSIAKVALSVWGRQWRGIGLLSFLSKTDWELLYPSERDSQVISCFQPDHGVQAAQGLQELKLAALSHAQLPYPLSALEATATAYLPEQIMVKVDRASMRTGLECRAPFLDAGLMQFATSLPVSYHFAKGMGKALLRDALPVWVPPQIRWRRKQGFTPPLARWLRCELKTQMARALDEDLGNLKHLLNPLPARELYRQHLAGADHSQVLFRWLVLARRCWEAVIT